MAFEIYGLDITLPTATDLSADQYCAVNVDANGNAVLPAVGGVAIGVLQNNPSSGQSASVRVEGVSYLIATDVIAKGALVAVDATGKAKAASAATANTTTGALTGSFVLGIALDGAAAAGDYVSVLIKQAGVVPGTYA